MPLAQGTRDQLALHPGFKLPQLPTGPRHPRAKSPLVCTLHQHERHASWAAVTRQQTMSLIVNVAVVASRGDRREVHREGHQATAAALPDVQEIVAEMVNFSRRGLHS